LVYQGPAEGMPKEQWRLRSPKGILDLKVCDMAMGSGAFLVQACRFLSERLVEAWENIEKEHPGEMLTTPEGEFSLGESSERLIPKDAAERLAIARRLIADRCICGVDINPMAVEMAKLSIWLITVDRSRPFTFLDHALKCGDSLLGICRLKQLETFSLDDEKETQVIILSNYAELIHTAVKKRRELELLPSNDIKQIGAKKALLAEADEHLERLKLATDLLIAAELAEDKEPKKDMARAAAHLRISDYIHGPILEFRRFVQQQLNGLVTLHWPLEFPEVFDHGGFDAFIGNPPFMGGSKLETAFGRGYRALIVSAIARRLTGVRGSADLCTYFLLRAEMLSSPLAFVGMIVTNSLGQGDAREVGFTQVLRRGHAIFRARPSSPWPGQATVFYAMVWISIRAWQGDYWVDDREVVRIDASLTAAEQDEKTPSKLKANEGIAFEGAKLSGEGFVVPLEWAMRLLNGDSRYSQVVRPYLTGAILNGSPTLQPEEYVVTFYDWPLSHKMSAATYRGPVAEDFPECLAWVEQKVRPGRMELEPSTPWNRKLREFWWHFGQWRWALDEALDSVSWVLVLSRVTPHVIVERVDKNWVFSDRLTVFTIDSELLFGVLQSAFHEVWSRRYGTTNLSLLSYSPSACFLTLPLPHSESETVNARVVTIIQNIASERRRLAREEGVGLTEIYNRLHEKSEKSEDVMRLRALHAELDQAVAAAYGWSELDLEHGFHETKQGVRFTIGETARRKLLDRLLALNGERYEQEVLAGLHEKKAKAGGAKRASPRKKRMKDTAAQGGLY